MDVYERWLFGAAEKILQTDNTSVRQLLIKAGFSKFPYTGDEALLCDCNTKEEFNAACSITL